MTTTTPATSEPKPSAKRERVRPRRVDHPDESGTRYFLVSSWIIFEPMPLSAACPGQAEACPTILAWWRRRFRRRYPGLTAGASMRGPVAVK